MKNCPKCNRQLEDDASFCSECGSAVYSFDQPSFASEKTRLDIESGTGPNSFATEKTAYGDSPLSIDHLIGEMVFGYKIIEEIGQGGMGVVYKADHPNIGKTVAIKFLLPAFSKSEQFVIRFEREAKAMVSLSNPYHPNIVKIENMGEYKGLYFLIMEYIPGRPLDEVIHEKERLDWQEAIRIAKQILLALKTAHSRGMLHRDIKPGNILIADNGIVNVVDFGLVKMMGIGEEISINEARSRMNNSTVSDARTAGISLSVEGSPIGTFDYMSPEQHHGESNLDERTDIYSFGMTLYKMIAGKIARFGSSPFSSIDSSIPERLDTICMKCLAEDKNDRYRNVDLVLIELDQVLRNRKVLRSKEGSCTFPKNGKKKSKVKSGQADGGSRRAIPSVAKKIFPLQQWISLLPSMNLQLVLKNFLSRISKINIGLIHLFFSFSLVITSPFFLPYGEFTGVMISIISKVVLLAKRWGRMHRTELALYWLSTLWEIYIIEGCITSGKFDTDFPLGLILWMLFFSYCESFKIEKVSLGIITSLIFGFTYLIKKRKKRLETESAIYWLGISFFIIIYLTVFYQNIIQQPTVDVEWGFLEFNLFNSKENEILNPYYEKCNLLGLLTGTIISLIVGSVAILKRRGEMIRAELFVYWVGTSSVLSFAFIQFLQYFTSFFSDLRLLDYFTIALLPFVLNTFLFIKISRDWNEKRDDETKIESKSKPHRSEKEKHRGERRRHKDSMILRWFVLLMLILASAGGLYYTFQREERQPTHVGPPGQSTTINLGKGIKLDFVWIPPGEFTMGSPVSEEGHYKDESPQHLVRIKKGFWMGKYEVTYEQYLQYVRAGAGREPEKNDNDAWTNLSGHPVVDISWDDAIGFCQWLSHETGKAFRLPTEAEWEYACRSGTDTALYTGPLTIVEYGNGPELDSIAWYRGNSGNGYPYQTGYDSSNWSKTQYKFDRTGTRKVGQKAPNSWGLHDMIGNVREWCKDWFGSNYYQISPKRNPQGPPPGWRRVIRGGSWFSGASACRAASRERRRPESQEDTIGFRVVTSSLLPE